MISVCSLLLFLTASSPLLDVTDSMDRGATAVYNVSLDDGTVYWLVLKSVGEQTNFDVIVASSEMDFDHFLDLPYGEDFFYAMDFALASGVESGDESVTLTTESPGLVYIVVHDSGGNGGTYSLKIN